jgi:hypothetical protein
MYRLFASHNIRHCRDRLWWEVDPEARARLQKLLIAEEEKLGNDVELLADLDRHISDGKRRIDRQRALVATMECDGHNGLAQARILLDCMLQTQLLHQAYRRRILIAVGQNKLLTD